jgi:hypothetical protein
LKVGEAGAIHGWLFLCLTASGWKTPEVEWLKLEGLNGALFQYVSMMSPKDSMQPQNLSTIEQPPKPPSGDLKGV